jgi:hypothetical protein
LADGEKYPANEQEASKMDGGRQIKKKPNVDWRPRSAKSRLLPV